jgi:hypothetical protein
MATLIKREHLTRALVSSLRNAILKIDNDDSDQIRDETARQSRWALRIGLTIR